MTWNWQLPDWPNFQYDQSKLNTFESKFLLESGKLLGVFQHIDETEMLQLKIKFIEEEAIHTSKIEGEALDRKSLQSSIQKHFGLKVDLKSVRGDSERGIASLFATLYKTYAKALTHDDLFKFHEQLMLGRTDLESVGMYRRHEEPMQIVSGPDYAPKVHFEAPPSARVYQEMTRLIDWYNDAVKMQVPALTRAGIAHLWFESIHPFEDGNGRIGRAISEKALAQAVGRPTLIALSTVIQKKRKAYYNALQEATKKNDITEWLCCFSETILSAVAYTQKSVAFFMSKAELFDRLKTTLNFRQEKVLLKLFAVGIDGFEGGLSAENYIQITGSTRATATRDLTQLVALGALKKEGVLKHTRYYLNLGSID